MARITDQKKIERLRNSTMKLVAEKGYGGASAVLIALDAKVATGYFYRHYVGKYELVNTLLSEVYQEVANKLDELIQQGSSFNTLIANTIEYFIDMANKEPIKSKFFYVLSSDYSFRLDPEMKTSIFGYLNKIMEIGHQSGELDKNVCAEDLFLFMLINTIQYINQKFKNSGKKIRLTQSDQDHLLYLLNKLFKVI